MMKHAIENKDEILRKDKETKEKEANKTTENNHKTSELTREIAFKIGANDETKENRNPKEWMRNQNENNKEISEEMTKDILENKDDNIRGQNTTLTHQGQGLSRTEPQGKNYIVK